MEQQVSAFSKGPTMWPAMARAVGELALARVRLGRQDIGDFAPEAAPDANLTSAEKTLAEQLAWLIPRVARRMPWRSDCLVQAMAARRWLAGKGIASSLHIGSRKCPARGFEAHAWLTVGDLVVTGWDIERFDQFAEFPARRDS